MDRKEVCGRAPRAEPPCLQNTQPGEVTPVMKITDVKSHVLQYPLDEKLGYSQMYFDRRTAHIVEVITDEGIHVP